MAAPSVGPLISYQANNTVEEHSDGEVQQRDGNPFGYSKFSIKLFVSVMKFFFVILVTGCLVMSKLTIVEVFARFNQLVNLTIFNTSTDRNKAPSQDLRQTANLYWQLLLIMMIPSFLTWIYSIFKGIFSRSLHHPWPKKSAVALGVVIAVMEAFAESILYFVVFVSIPPEVVIFAMSGLFSVQGILNAYLAWSLASTNDNSRYEQIGSSANVLFISSRKKILLIVLFIIGVCLQLGGLGLECVFLINAHMIVVGCLMVVSLLILSFVWTNTIQKLTFRPSRASIIKARTSKTTDYEKPISARWKATFVAATIRLILYPIISYCIVRFFYQVKKDSNTIVDPWCIHYITKLKIHDAFSWSKHDSSVFAVHIVTSFVVNVVQGVSCYMTLHKFGLALPVFLATPISVAVYFLSNSPVSIRYKVNLYFFPFTDDDAQILDWTHTITSVWFALMFAVAIVIWIGQHLITAYNLLMSKNAILASNENMFVRPYYNSILLEQYQAINRCVTGTSPRGTFEDVSSRDPMQVFICSTMYRENPTEMRQLLRSLYRIAKYCERRRGQLDDTFESHIFFDGGCNGKDLSQFAIQLMSLISSVMKVKLAEGDKQQTPYGYRFSWKIAKCMPFVIHLKDNHKIKNKKRWSQVMYMNYILKYRAQTDKLDLSNTFILTTDADIDFKAEAAVVLLDMLARDSTVGAVCARTHPLGFGLLYWYQIFDYAIGHWFQKGAEHILGSVLCCPGCFSMFRCSALETCLETYSSEVENAVEFLMKDMGEDRWLCTLLVEKGWRLEYCAISNNYTYCPVEFDEFFKQRRRWIPSTIANLWLLVSRGSKMTSGNDSIGWLFIIYQMFIIVSTVIAPATVMLIISSGLQISFSFNAIGVIVTLLVITVVYGFVCLYASQQTQLDLAKLLSFIFSVVMAVVVVGIVKEILKDVIEIASSDNNDNNGSSDGQLGSFQVPVGETTIYVGLFAFAFVICAMLHYKEFLTLFHCLWYLLGLPSGYLLLLVYSTANLNSRSWGTREKSDNSQGVLGTIWGKVKVIFKKCFAKFSILSEKNEALKENTDDNDEPKHNVKHQAGGLEDPTQHSYSKGGDNEYPWLRKWLRKYDCEKFYDCFANEGYTEEWYFTGMSEQDLRDIGVQPEGYVRHLTKAMKTLSPHPIKVGIPKSIEDWLVELNMGYEEDEYINKFHNAGYFGPDDVEHLQLITKAELVNDIGIRKKAHVNRLLQALRRVKMPSEDENRMINAQTTLQQTYEQPQKILDDEETTFWEHQLNLRLHPIPESLSQTSGLKDELKYLRNSVLIAFLLINLIWIILLYVLTIDELKTLGLNNKFLSLLFLSVYGVIVLVQFSAMLFHRTVTLSHYISRLNQSLPVEQTFELTETVRRRNV